MTRPCRRPVSCLVLALATWLGARVVLAAEPPDVPVTLALEDQANEIWAAMPETAGDARVTRLAGTSTACAQNALRMAREAVGRGQAGRLALRTLALSLPLPRTLLKAAHAPNAGYLGHVVGLYVQSTSEDDFVVKAAPWRSRATPETASAVEALRALYRRLLVARSDHALQPLLEPACGPGVAVYELRALADKPGRLYLHMGVEGGCGCSGPVASGSDLRRFSVVGQAELEPGGSSFGAGGVTQRFRVKEASYFVLASCRSCGGQGDERAAQTPETPGACGPPCAPLAHNASAWQDEVARVGDEVSRLAQGVSALEGRLASQRKELEAAEAAPRKPPSTRDRILRLKDQLQRTQSELGRLSRAAGEVKEHAAAMRGAADDARAAGERCQAQCDARQQNAEHAPDQVAAQGAASGATGGGLGAGKVVLGGVLAAAGGTAAVIALKGDEDQGLAGTWEGTRIINNGPLFENCTRVFDEVWSIRVSGADVVADVTAIGQGCGTASCGQDCKIFPFPWQHFGTTDGTNVQFVVYGGTSCIFHLRLAGDALSGSMSPCNEASGMTQELSLRRKSK